MIWLRSTLFNICFYAVGLLASTLCFPSLFFRREASLWVVHKYARIVHWLEIHILGLDFEIRGAENIPKSGAYIVAAKHQSPYETLKLYKIFDDPVIVLKKELTRIPMWGKFLARMGPIAIDRKMGKKATEQIIDGAKRVKKEGRPLVIFPQGTRVYPWTSTQEKPYKAGAARMHVATGLPIIPLALNTGLFWPRVSWTKKPGKVIFEYLPALPAEDDVDTLTAMLEEQLESHSIRLMKETQAQNPKLYKFPPGVKDLP